MMFMLSDPFGFMFYDLLLIYTGLEMQDALHTGFALVPVLILMAMLYSLVASMRGKSTSLNGNKGGRD